MGVGDEVDASDPVCWGSLYPLIHRKRWLEVSE